MIKFEKHVERAELLDPTNEFKKREMIIEVRRDPLTGRLCRININRASRPRHEVREERLKEIIDASRKNCPFCPDNVDRSTPKFPREIVEEGRITIGNFTLFPNLYPFSTHHAVGILTKKHFLRLNGFSKRIWTDCITGSIEFFKRIIRISKFKFPSINLNYLSPAGASLVHPHVQVLVTERPSSFMRIVMKRCRSYKRLYGSNYFEDLIRTEKKLRLRYIGRTGNVSWISSFSPSFSHEVLGVSKRCCLLDFKGSDISNLGSGLERVFKAYHSMGIVSVNMSIFSAPVGNDYDVNCFVRVAPRNLHGFWISDRGFVEELHNEYVVSTLPEDTATFIKKFF